MDGLFSHAASSGDDFEESAPLPEFIHTVSVPVPIDQAFEGFTDYIHLWWPVNVYSHFGPGSHVSFSQGQLLEESEEGEQHLWGAVVDLDVPARIVLDFSLGMESAAPTKLAFEFADSGTGTAVTVRHGGWARGSAGEAQYARYARWPEVIAYYARFMGAHS